MAVKRKNQKVSKLKESYNRSVKIKCCYCDINATCLQRAYKEGSEKMGITTYCAQTPNRPKSFAKKMINKA